jgi:hypothetical protein
VTSQSTAPLRSRLVDQAASDLAENRRLQQELSERLSVLKREEALLTDILSLAQRYEGFADSARLPEQVQDEPTVAKAKRARTGSGTRRSGSGSGSGSGSAKTTRAGHAAQAKTRPPLLGDLLLDLLGKHDEPRPAKELRDELLRKHPDRNPTPQVVRNTLESLVAKGRIQRHKEDRAVMYTVVKSGSDT